MAIKRELKKKEKKKDLSFGLLLARTKRRKNLGSSSKSSVLTGTYHFFFGQRLWLRLYGGCRTIGVLSGSSRSSSRSSRGSSSIVSCRDRRSPRPV